MATRDEESRSLGDAKAHFAECVRAAERGRTTILTRHGRPVARLVPLDAIEVREPSTNYEARSAPSVRSPEARKAALQRLLEQEIWPQIPEEMIGKAPSKEERERILGLKEEGG